MSLWLLPENCIQHKKTVQTLYNGTRTSSVQHSWRPEHGDLNINFAVCSAKTCTVRRKTEGKPQIARVWSMVLLSLRFLHNESRTDQSTATRATQTKHT